MVTENKGFSVQCSVFRKSITGCTMPSVPILAESQNLTCLPEHRTPNTLSPEPRTPNTCLRTFVYLTAVLSLCGLATGCGRRSAPPASADLRPTASDLRTPAAHAQQTQQPQTAVALAPESPSVPAAASTLTNAASAASLRVPVVATSSVPTEPATWPPSLGVRHPAAKSATPETIRARQIAEHVQAADAAVRATPAGSQAWARVVQAQATYEATLRGDPEYAAGAEKVTRLEAEGTTNTFEEAGSVGVAMTTRERALLRDQPVVAHAKAERDAATAAYGALVQCEPRFREAVKMNQTETPDSGRPVAPSGVVGEKGNVR